MLTFSGVTIPVPSNLLNQKLIYKFSRFINKSFIGKYFLIAISRYSSKIFLYSAKDDRKLYEEKINEKHSYLNIGSGFFCHPNWECLDLAACSPIYKAVQGKPRVDFLPFNLNTDSLSIFPSESYNGIYSSHTLEHLKRERIHYLFQEIYGLLVSGGTFRICVPDLISLYCVNSSSKKMNLDDMKLFIRETYTPLYHYIVQLDIDKQLFHFNHLHTVIEKVKFNDYISYLIDYADSLGISRLGHPPDFHVAYPTEDFLLNIANEVGFSFSYRTVRGVSHASFFSNKCLFDTTIPDFSLYMEFIK